MTNNIRLGANGLTRLHFSNYGKEWSILLHNQGTQVLKILQYHIKYSFTFMLRSLPRSLREETKGVLIYKLYQIKKYTLNLNALLTR